MRLTRLFLIIISFCFLSCKNSNDDNKIKIIDKSIRSIINQEAEIEVIADSLFVSEGPLWDEKIKSLLFTDVAQNKIFKWNKDTGVEEYIVPSGYTAYAPSFKEGLIGANGITFNNNGRLVVCQHGDRRLAVIENIGTKTPSFITLVDNYMGMRFNSPNDLAISQNGDVYFTDPPYGFFDIASQIFNNKYKELDYSGVYKLSSTGDLSLISNEMTLPNGIALTLDEKFLFVNNSDADNPVIILFNVATNKGELFFDGTELSKQFEGGFDGLKVHSSGNIFTSGPNGILIISPKGELKATIDLGGGVTNCAFDTNEENLFVTGFSKVYKIQLK